MTTPLHIVIDARWIFPKISGIGYYTQELIGAIARAISPHRFTLLFSDTSVRDRTAAATGFDQNNAFRTEIVTRGPYAPANHFAMPPLLRGLGADVYHSTNAMLPFCPLGRIKRVVTIHDLIPLLFRDHAPRAKKNRFYPVYKWLMHQTAAKADLIIAVSESTRNDIMAHLAIPAKRSDKVRVIYEGVRPEYTPAKRAPHDGVVFLFVGRRDPYKNLPMLVESVAELRKEGLPARLRVVGSDDPRYPEARERSAALGVDPFIEWSGYIPEEQLVSAYQQADVYVLPSRYEGFGLPVLEAMACGTPVICSKTSSLPEVAGDSALLIDPAVPSTLTAAMRRLINEQALRDDLSRRGRLRAARFSWDDTAVATLAAYESVASK